MDDATSREPAAPPAAAGPTAPAALAAPAAPAPPKAKPWERGSLPGASSLAPTIKPAAAPAVPAAAAATAAASPPPRAPAAPPPAAVDPSVAQAVRFISNAAVQHTTAAQKRAFLLGKGLTEAQV